MQNKPIDTSRFSICLAVSEPELRTDPATGAARLDREGRQQWVVAVAVMPKGGRRSDADVIDVVTTTKPEGVAEGMPVKLVDLWTMDWAVDGRTGTSWRAGAVVPVSASGGPRGKASGGES